MKQIKGYEDYYIDESGAVYSNRKGSYKPLKEANGRVRLVNPEDSSKRKILRVSRLYMQAYNKLLPRKVDER
ncbi:hypothetical protein [Paenibacillus massiliensis]|uniref:hypothetical protein n=1 Tax=Paenibacillus massiliensis TaxID=225917 RepID=UPI00048FF1DA|nr:hypothetical protein [Paenibacillus massiliensis]